MSNRHAVMDTCDRCRKRFNPLAGGGLVTLKEHAQNKRYLTLCDDCLVDIERTLYSYKKRSKVS